ncbi:MAG: hypothetical protein ACJ710_14815 [Ornithinibacter sp.]
MKKVRAAALIAVVTTVVSTARDYARDNPDQAGETLDQVERFVRGKLAAQHGAYVDKVSAGLRQGLGLPARGDRDAGTPRDAGAPHDTGAPLTDPDPEAVEPRAPRGVGDPVAPNPSPGTSDDPQPRRWDDDPAPLTPGERPRR